MLLLPDERQFAAAVNRYLYANRMYSPDSDAICAAILAVDLRLSPAERARPRIATPGWPFVEELVLRAETILARVLARWKLGRVDPTPRDLFLYEDLVLSVLFYRFFAVPTVLAESRGKRRIKAYALLIEHARPYLAIGDLPMFQDMPHLFAVFAQIRRAVELIPQTIRGNSRAIHQLRAAIWNSIFPQETEELNQRLYGAVLFDRMHEITTLILGPSGVGKELVARLVGGLRYVAFDAAKGRFVESFDDGFHAINLAALSPDLIESEVFGHAAGSFTGAVRDKTGWLERCARGQSVFLDEIGELDEAIQVKLLRVLQTREFYRVGETALRRFEGKVIAATNRDLAAQIMAGRFREDLFYRLCSDVIVAPSLRQQLDDCPSDLPLLVRLVAERCLGPRATPEQVDWLTATSVAWIERCPELGPHYGWPGNFRQLEQCIRNVMVRGEYHPPQLPPRTAALTAGSASSPPIAAAHRSAAEQALDALAADVRASRLTYDELLTRYCSLVFARAPNLTTAAKQLGKHRATIEGRVDLAWVERFRGG